MTISTNRESERFMLRLPDGMRDRIKAAAEASGRSMNAEIVAALESRFPEPGTLDDVLREMEASLRIIRNMPKLMAAQPDLVRKMEASIEGIREDLRRAKTS